MGHAARVVETDLELVRCVCGAVVYELVIPVGARLAGRGVLLRYKCQRCARHIIDYHPEAEGLPKGRLLVMHVIDLHTGDLIPDQVEIWKDHVAGNRSAMRGQERLPRAMLDDALAIRERTLAQARSGSVNDGC